MHTNLPTSQGYLLPPVYKLGFVSSHGLIWHGRVCSGTELNIIKTLCVCVCVMEGGLEEWDREEEFEKHGSSKDPERGKNTHKLLEKERESRGDRMGWAGGSDCWGSDCCSAPQGKGIQGGTTRMQLTKVCYQNPSFSFPFSLSFCTGKHGITGCVI